MDTHIYAQGLSLYGLNMINRNFLKPFLSNHDGCMMAIVDSVDMGPERHGCLETATGQRLENDQGGVS